MPVMTPTAAHPGGCRAHLMLHAALILLLSYFKNSDVQLLTTICTLVKVKLLI